MSDDIYLAVTYHISTPIMTRFLFALKRGWNSFMIPAVWLNKTTSADLNRVGLDKSPNDRTFFGKTYCQLYKI